MSETVSPSVESPEKASFPSRARHLPSALIINADDWGRDAETTGRTLECFRRGSLSSVSAMVFMADSERAARLALESGIDAGLHLNFTTGFSSSTCPPELAAQQQRISRYLRRSRLAQVIFHPGLAAFFKRVVAAQIEEFRRLYGVQPARIDGHHHMHLCANVVRANLLPEGAIVRRNFSFAAGEKSWINRFYRSQVDKRLAQRHSMTDYLFSLPPLQPPGRLKHIFSLAQESVVELETHPVAANQYQFLTSGEMFEHLGSLRVAPGFVCSISRPTVAPSAARNEF